MEKLKISIIEPVGKHGGNDIYDSNLVNSMNMQENLEATLYTSSVDEKLKNENIICVYNGIYGDDNKFVRLFRYLKGTFKALSDSKKRSADIIHLHFFGFNVLEYMNLYLSKKVFGFKVVGTVHDVESFEKFAKNENTKHDYEKFLNKLDGIVVHTDYAKNELLKNIKDLNISSEIKTIYACDLDYSTLDENKIDKKEARKKLNLPEDKKIILFFGQIKTVKGLDVLLESLNIIKDEIPDVLLVVAGKVWKDDFSKYDEIIKKYNLEKYVDLRIGFVANKDVEYYFNATDIIALPYRKIYNSGVLIRAMSFATPVVASDFGPFAEFIEDGKNGYLFKTENKEDLAKKIVEALKNPMLEEIGKKGKDVIKEKFALEKIGKDYKDFYQKVMGGEG